MSRNAATMTPGNANRRFIYLAVALGLLGAILVYVAFSRDGGSSVPGSSSSAATTAVLVAKVDIPARTKITQQMVEVRLMSADSVGALALGDPAMVVGQVTRYPIAVNEQILSTKIVALSGTAAVSRALSYVIPQGKRGFAIGVSQIQAAGGLLLPGDYVDVILLSDVEFGGDSQGDYLVQTFMQNVEVLAVSQGVVDIVAEATPTEGGQRVRNSDGAPDPGAATVTLALTPEQLEKMYLAEVNGKIRLSLRPFGEGGEKPVDLATKNDLFPPNIPRPVTR